MRFTFTHVLVSLLLASYALSSPLQSSTSSMSTYLTELEMVQFNDNITIVTVNSDNNTTVSVDDTTITMHDIEASISLPQQNLTSPSTAVKNLENTLAVMKTLFLFGSSSHLHPFRMQPKEPFGIIFTGFAFFMALSLGLYAGLGAASGATTAHLLSPNNAKLMVESAGMGLFSSIIDFCVTTTAVSLCSAIISSASGMASTKWQVLTSMIGSYMGVFISPMLFIYIIAHLYNVEPFIGLGAILGYYYTFSKVARDYSLSLDFHTFDRNDQTMEISNWHIVSEIIIRMISNFFGSLLAAFVLLNTNTRPGAFVMGLFYTPSLIVLLPVISSKASQ